MVETHGLRMPALFIGHGSPMNAIEDNVFSRGWADAARRLPAPAAVLCVSAHWETAGVRVTSSRSPETIHDFYGFPRALFDVRYPAPGDPSLARSLAREHAPLVAYPDLGPDARLAVPTPEHYLPLLYVLALQEDRDEVVFFNDAIVMGSVSMTSLTVSCSGRSPDRGASR